VLESAEECSRAALVHARCWMQQEEMLDCLIWAAVEESPVLGAVVVDGWEPVWGRGCWSISEVRKPAKRRSELLLGLHAEQEEKNF